MHVCLALTNNEFNVRQSQITKKKFKIQNINNNVSQNNLTVQFDHATSNKQHAPTSDAASMTSKVKNR